VDGGAAGAACSRWRTVKDPSTGEALAQVPESDAALVDAALVSAQAALRQWRGRPATERAGLLHGLAAALRDREKGFAALLSRETGKPVRAALAEVQNGASLIDYFAEEILRLRGALPLLGQPRQQLLILREPIGVVVAITPFNYPLSTLICKMAPALGVGCTVVAKPDEHTPLCTLELARLATEVGLPPGVFNCVTGTGPGTGTLLVNHSVPRLVAFTGSTAVGKIIQAACAPWVRKTILELGGHCPAIVSADAPWRDLMPALVAQMFKNSGQYCYRISRALVDRRIYADFVASLVETAARLRVAPASDPAADLGPLNHEEILASVSRHVDQARREGARVLLGGVRLSEPPFDRGCYYPPTLLTEVHAGMTLMHEEVFGPVATIQPYENSAEALEMANATRYGLAAYVFSGDLGNALAWAGQIESGSVWINQIHQAYPEAPFGGIKESGLGREKSHFGVEEYTELKTVYLSY
jgi:succinate-semialdehyde dehydrogenase/glutarate-semialdehyde dehydrogenase